MLKAFYRYGFKKRELMFTTNVIIYMKSFISVLICKVKITFPSLVLNCRNPPFVQTNLKVSMN